MTLTLLRLNEMPFYSYRLTNPNNPKHPNKINSQVSSTIQGIGKKLAGEISPRHLSTPFIILKESLGNGNVNDIARGNPEKKLRWNLEEHQ